jgi:hypothetical protein
MAELTTWGPQAVAMKWLGPMQKFDPTDPAHDRFYDQVRELGLPLIIHSGCEHTFPGMAQHFGNPKLYEGLIKRGIPVIFSHCGTGSFLFPQHDYSREFVEMVERYDNVYGDTSAFASLVRRKEMRRFAADRYVGRIVHGSDFPVPTNAYPFLRELGFAGTLALDTIRHPFDRDVRVKRRMGMPDACFDMAYTILEKRITAWEAARVSRRRGWTGSDSAN